MTSFVDITTLILAGISAIGVVWTAAASHRQTRLLEKQTERAEPIIEADYYPFDDMPPAWSNWRRLVVTVTNTENVKIEVTRISVRRWSRIRIFPEREALTQNGFNEDVLANNPPDEGKKTIKGKDRILTVNTDNSGRGKAEFLVLVNFASPTNRPRFYLYVTYRWADRQRTHRRIRIII